MHVRCSFFTHLQAKGGRDVEELNNMPVVSFPPGTEEIAIKLAAYDIVRQLCDEGKITKEELKFIAEKYDIRVA